MTLSETRCYRVADQPLEIEFHGVAPTELAAFRHAHATAFAVENVLAFLQRETFLSRCLPEVLDDLSLMRLAHPTLLLFMRVVPTPR